VAPERLLGQVPLTESAAARAQLLAQLPLFAALAPAHQAELADLLRRRRYAPDEVIFHEGDPGAALYIIESGAVAVRLSSYEGKEVVLALLGRGDVLGELALLDGEPRSADAVARESTQLLALQRDDFLRFLTASPPAAISLLAVLSRRLRRTDRLVHDVAFLDVPARLARAVLELATSAPADPRAPARAAGPPATPRLTQGELATLAGTTRESANRWLQSAERRGLLRRERGRILLLDPERLRREL
jgi:CRP-like cAMP-binding protein